MIITENTNINMGSGKIAANIPELRRIKASAENLIDEIKARSSGVLQQARSIADWAYGEYGSDVSNYTRSVLTQCNNVSTANAAALSELMELVRGIDKAITGYAALEQDLGK